MTGNGKHTIQKKVNLGMVYYCFTNIRILPGKLLCYLFGSHYLSTYVPIYLSLSNCPTIQASIDPDARHIMTRQYALSGLPSIHPLPGEFVTIAAVVFIDREIHSLDQASINIINNPSWMITALW